jgi:tetratricopeptide (TPR) repeat protein
MSKRFGLTTCLLVLLVAVSAQQKLNYADVDKKSYDLYTEQKWAELIDFADEARSNGIDYFYLQARTGIACYNLKKYRKAADFFLKAWKNDQSFEWLQEYLYYSLVYSGRSVEASKYAAQFSVPVKVKINYQNMKPLRAALEIGYSFNPDFDVLSNRSFDEELNVGSDYGEAFILKNYHFESVDYSHQLAPGVFLSHNFTHLGINREEQVFWGERNSFPVDISQNQYFINPTFVLGRKWYVSPSANVIWGKSNLVLGNYDPNTFYSTTVKFSDFIFSTSTWGHFGNFAPGAEVNFANIYNDGFTQLSGWLTVYPLSNTKLYFTPRVYFKSDKENGFGYNTFGISGGAQLGPVHFYGQYLTGDMKNFIEPAGYVVANFPGRSKQKIMGSLYFPVAKKYQFVVRYINQDIIEKYNVYTSGTITNSLEYKYIKHTLTAGISWNF